MTGIRALDAAAVVLTAGLLAVIATGGGAVAGVPLRRPEGFVVVIALVVLLNIIFW